jgi:hypothetical protein
LRDLLEEHADLDDDETEACTAPIRRNISSCTTTSSHCPIDGVGLAGDRG